MYASHITPIIELGGVNVSRLNFKGTLEWIDARLKTPVFTQVATANMDFLDLCSREPELKSILNGKCHLVTADGMPLVWLSRAAGLPVAERVPGSDLVPAVTRLAAAQKLSVFFLGGNTEATFAAVNVLREKNPGLKVAGVNCARFNDSDPKQTAPIVNEIRLSKAQVLFVALGCPKQERFIAQHAEQLGVRLAMGVGGSFDFIAGHRRRAPIWLQRVGLEWACRMAQEPRRLAPRYGKNLVYFARLVALIAANKIFQY